MNPDELLEDNEISPVSCYSCGKSIEYKYKQYKLLLKTFNKIVPLSDTPEKFQQLYDRERKDQLNIVKQVNMKAVKTLTDLGFKLLDADGEINREKWRKLNQLTKQYNIAQSRARTRELMGERSLAELRRLKLVELGIGSGAAAERQIVKMDFSAIDVLGQIVKMEAPQEKLAYQTFLNSTLGEQLAEINYPIPDGDPDWLKNSRKQLGLTEEISVGEIQEALEKIGDIPLLLVLPNIKFDSPFFASYFTESGQIISLDKKKDFMAKQWGRNWSSLKGIDLSGVADKEFKTVKQFSSYGGIAMRYLGLVRNCCRQYMLQPGILRQEASLTLEEMREGEKMDPNSLVYSRYTNRMDKPLLDIEKRLLEGNLEVSKVLDPRNTYSLLCIKTSSSISIKSAINAMKNRDLQITNTQLPSNLPTRSADLNLAAEKINTLPPPPSFLDGEVMPGDVLDNTDNIQKSLPPPPTFIGGKKEEELITAHEIGVIPQLNEEPTRRTRKKKSQTRQPGGLKLRRGRYEAL